MARSRGRCRPLVAEVDTYAPNCTLSIEIEPPSDLQQALDKHPKVKQFFAALDSQNRYAILFRSQNVKRAQTRARKISEFIDMLNRGEKIRP